MNTKQLRSKVDTLRGQEKQVRKNLTDAESRLEQYQTNLERHEEAREVLRQAALKTQEALAFHISDITSLAMDAVFPDPYNLVVEFVQRRNKTECDLKFERDGSELDPIEASGGGAVDVAAFALRVASWSMETPASRPVIVLDEPMRFLSTGLQPKASEMLAELSNKLGVQFIIVTHEEELTENADKIIEVFQQQGITKIKEQ